VRLGGSGRSSVRWTRILVGMALEPAPMCFKSCLRCNTAPGSIEPRHDGRIRFAAHIRQHGNGHRLEPWGGQRARASCHRSTRSRKFGVAGVPLLADRRGGSDRMRAMSKGTRMLLWVALTLACGEAIDGPAGREPAVGVGSAGLPAAGPQAPAVAQPAVAAVIQRPRTARRRPAPDPCIQTGCGRPLPAFGCSGVCARPGAPRCFGRGDAP
jgi:hypothetical protein